MFEQFLKKINGILHTNAAYNSQFGCVEQTSWIIFLKTIDNLNQNKQITIHIQTASAITTEQSVLLEEIKTSSQELVEIAQRLQQSIGKLQ
ncbi:MAG: hypothetical protein H6Q68_3461 [Firmicutes bacterium]|nr:hypothetical protein [Bacillota bacterium]